MAAQPEIYLPAGPSPLVWDMDRETLIRHASALYGERWQTQLARALTEIGGRIVTQPQVAQWVAKKRPIPDWVGHIFPLVIELEAEALQERAREAFKRLEELQREEEEELRGPSM